MSTFTQKLKKEGTMMVYWLSQKFKIVLPSIVDNG